ncbi:thiol peroxidase [Thorsellia anophelis]|uniref:Thiol peroxidase n=1 Tax=Thorsellia anophelis DSM 18579 TaxID=1123402 RepID=A0A1I0EYM4_9GAMM|nr:thiol peroxidase [Thorsellia anophelis]SET50455.1 thiol peroxidase, atypical 2-Cys peroxiredoxin [Thorsellia anophelis DSM 18579]
MSNTVTFKGTPVALSGNFPKVGESAPKFNLVAADLSDLTLDLYGTQRKVLNIFPSVDTGVCATSVRRFNDLASHVENTTVICISADLPFAQSRFCGAEGLEDVKTASTFRSDFLEVYGVKIAEGALKGLAARAVLVLDADNKVIHAELVSEIGTEPNYDAAMSVLK